MTSFSSIHIAPNITSTPQTAWPPCGPPWRWRTVHNGCLLLRRKSTQQQSILSTQSSWDAGSHSWSWAELQWVHGRAGAMEALVQYKGRAIVYSCGSVILVTLLNFASEYRKYPPTHTQHTYHTSPPPTYIVMSRRSWRIWDHNYAKSNSPIAVHPVHPV